MITYGVGTRADFRASNFKTELAGTSFQLDAQDRSFLVRFPLIGKFNIYNSLAALAAASAFGIPLRAAILALATAPPVPGRLQLVPGKRSYQVYVDYAHTDDALHNVLRTLRDLNPRRLIVVFGCGGDRDRAKRPLMGRAAEQWSDYAIITSDNPRSESPEAIIRDIEQGLKGDKYEVVVDRAEAIKRAVALGGSARHRAHRWQGTRDLPAVRARNDPLRRRSGRPRRPSKTDRSIFPDRGAHPMQSSEDKHFTGGMDFFIQHPGRDVDVSHYLRQVTITRRRHDPDVNQAWCRNQRFLTKLSTWKH